MTKKRFSDVVEWDEHIEPYRIIQFVAGVGSGKNYWVENDLMCNQRVLLITSRKAKANETSNRLEIGQCLNFSTLEKNSLNYFWSEDRKDGSCVCNNWQIEYYMKYRFDANDPSTYLWQFFDIIVVDESHSLATDAIYSGAPFHLYEFIKALYLLSDLKILLMTATFDPIKNLIRLKNKNNYAHWDFSEECINIIPKKLEYKERKRALSNIVSRYNKDPNGKWHTVYFTTKESSIRNEILPYLINSGIKEEHIAVSFSKITPPEGYSSTILDNKERTEKYLIEHEDIPPEIKIFITTSRNKEGINIKNDDFSWSIMIESHWIEEIQQMWGRVRSETVDAILVYDAPQHHSFNVYKDFDYGFDKTTKNHINKIFDKWCEKNDLPLSYRYRNKKTEEKIDFLHDDRFPFLRYSSYDDKFYKYKGRILGQDSFNNSIRFYDYIIKSAIKDEDASRLEELFSNNFVFYFPINEQKLLDEYIIEQGYLDRPISPEEKKSLLEYISNKLLIRQKKNKSKPYANLANALKAFGYSLKECSKHKGNKLYGYSILTKNKQEDWGEDWDDYI